MSTSGVDRTVAGLVRHLEVYGILPEVWHVDTSHRSVTERQADGVKVVELPARGRAASALLGLPDATRRFVRERRDEVDVLHLHSVFIPANVWLARLAQRPYVLTPHGGYGPRVLAGHNRAAKAVWMRVREREYVHHASLLHAVSPDEVDQLRSTFGPHPSVFVPNAIDLPSVATAPNERTKGPRRRVLFLGRLAVEHKGLDILLEGVARCTQGGLAPEIELLIAGPDFRSGQAELEAMAASLIPADVRFLGPVFGDEKDALLRSAYVFAHTSRWEGMPYAVLEALAAGCPVLLTHATNLGGFVEDFEAGVVVEETAQGVADGLRRVLEMPPERYAKMCRAARRLASERFNWSMVAEHMSAAYRRILR